MSVNSTINSDADLIVDFDSEYSGHDQSNEDYDDDEENYEDIQNEIYLQKILLLIDQFVFDDNQFKTERNINSMLPKNIWMELQIWRKKFRRKKRRKSQNSARSETSEYEILNKPIISPKIKLNNQNNNNVLVKNLNVKTLPKLSIIKNNSNDNNSIVKRIERISFSNNNNVASKSEFIRRKESKQLTLPPLLVSSSSSSSSSRNIINNINNDNKLTTEFPNVTLDRLDPSMDFSLERIMIEKKKINFTTRDISSSSYYQKQMMKSSKTTTTTTTMTTLPNRTMMISQTMQQSNRLQRINSLRSSSPIISLNVNGTLLTNHSSNNKKIRLPTLNQSSNHQNIGT